MAEEVLLPQMGESIAEGTITTWLKNVGDSVERDEPLYEMSTDKVDAEIPSPMSGTLLEIKVQPGQTVAVNTVVALIGEAGESADTSPAEEKAVEQQLETQSVDANVVALPAAMGATNTAPAGQSETVAAPISLEARRRTKSSPVVRKIAREHGIDIANLSGTGIGGRVTKKDILASIEGGGAAEHAASPAARCWS